MWSPHAGRGFVEARGYWRVEDDSDGWFRDLARYAKNHRLWKPGGKDDLTNFTVECRDFIDTTHYFIGRCGNAAVVGFADETFDMDGEYMKDIRAFAKEAALRVEIESEMSDFVATIIRTDGGYPVGQVLSHQWSMCVVK